ncbi:hypothetical protein Focb16_v011142 [Fusarium oxysporum f. sp. cubense]|uniref:Apple domain-containing protein n=1 Tax=Fusarium oxysporum f. sp. cubense TaxID=61366 RepID=A0A559L0L3_FUSOC|nr:hypothetical protein Focb16_v011142 [Fusarium oxysporum f. sp. cubense]
MARHLVRSFVLTSVLCSLANAGPCRPSTSSAVVATTTASESAAATTGPEKASESLTLSTWSATVTTNSETVDITKSPSTTFSVSFTTETSQAESTATTDTIVAVDTSSETSNVPGSQTQTATTTTASDAALTTTTEASTTTAAPVPSCVNNLKDPAPQDAFCATKGYPTANGDNLRYLGNGAVGTRLDCYRSCVETPECQSFAVQENGFCEMYRGSIGGTDGQNTSFEWYEPSCFCDTDQI